MTHQHDPDRPDPSRNDPIRQDYGRSDQGVRGLLPVLLGLFFLFVIAYMFLTADTRGPSPTSTTGIEQQAPTKTTPSQ